MQHRGAKQQSFLNYHVPQDKYYRKKYMQMQQAAMLCLIKDILIK